MAVVLKAQEPEERLTVTYVRSSTEKQERKHTVQTQLAVIEDNLWKFPNLKMVGAYRDEGVTGKLKMEERPDGARLLEDIRAGKVETLVVYDISRIGRTENVIHSFLAVTDEYHVTIVSISDGWDTANPQDREKVGLYAWLYALDRNKIDARMSSGKVRHAKEGKFVNGVTPYGYRRNEHNEIEIDPVEGDAVRLMFDLYVKQKMSVASIAQELNRRGIETPAKGRGYSFAAAGGWYAETVYRILTKTCYYGEYEWRFREHNGIYIPFPPLVSQDVWEEAERIRQGRWRSRSRQKYLLTGMVKCGHCGRAMCYAAGTKSDGFEGRVNVYRCSGHAKYQPQGEDKKCLMRPNVPADRLEELVWEQIVSWADRPEDVLAEFLQQQAGSADKLAVLRERIGDAEREVVKCETKRKRAMEAYQAEVYSLEELREAKRGIDEEEKEAKRVKARLQGEYDTLARLVEEGGEMEHALRTLGEVARREEVDKRRLVELFVKEITVTVGEAPVQGGLHQLRSYKAKVVFTLPLPERLVEVVASPGCSTQRPSTPP